MNEFHRDDIRHILPVIFGNTPILTLAGAYGKTKLACFHKLVTSASVFSLHNLPASDLVYARHTKITTT